MKKRINNFIKIITLFLLILILGLFITKAYSKQTINISNASVENVHFDLGEVFFGQTADKQFSIKNVSSNTLLLEGVTECGCTKLAIDGSYIEADSIVKVQLKYISSLKSTIGQIKNRFAIDNVVYSSPNSNKKTKTRILEGDLSIFVKPTISFVPKDLEVFIPEGNESKSFQDIEVKNVGSYPIKLELNKQNGNNVKLVVNPEVFTIEPNSKSTVSIELPALTEYTYLPYVSELVFSGSLICDDDNIPLEYFFPIKIVPVKLATASPGSLFFSRNELGNEKIIEISTSDDKRYENQNITIPDDIEVEELENNRFSVNLKADNIDTGTFNKKIVFQGLVDAHNVIIEVPVMGLN